VDDESQNSLFLNLLVTIDTLLAELTGGIMSSSLPLLSDGGTCTHRRLRAWHVHIAM
jgi:Co/Zn/Cd efflux system component